MNTERWFVSYKCVETDFLTQQVVNIEHKSTITDVTPARWLLYITLGSGMEHHILYAEQISLALASELAHGGTGIHSNYFKEEEK